MSSIEFDEPEISFRTIDISSAVTHNTPLLIKYRVVKDLKMANIVMLISCIIFIVGTIFIYMLRPSANQKIYKEDFSASEINHMLPDMVNNLPSKPR